MAEKKVAAQGGIGSLFSPIVIVGSLIVGLILYNVVMGDPSNFHNTKDLKAICEDPSISDCHPVSEGFGATLGLMYKGGALVPVALGIFLMLLVFSVERLIMLSAAKGAGSLDVFADKIRGHLLSNNVDSAIAECNRQKGAVGNVILELLTKYQRVEKDASMDKEQKIASLHKTLEENVALALPSLQKHLVIIATIVSLGTLLGLIGTVLGMIRAFSALGGGGGAPDAGALAVGISEALINTAVGISTSTIATIAYNYFSSVIESYTYKFDEIGLTVIETYAEKH